MSTDGGTSWSHRDQGLPQYPFAPGRISPNVLAFHPTDRQTVYAGAGFGVFVSTDAGDHWAPLITAMPSPDVTGIAFDPVRPQLMHVATRNGGMLRCEDGGRTCTRTLADHSLTVVATDPQKRHIVYAAGLTPDGRRVRLPQAPTGWMDYQAEWAAPSPSVHRTVRRQAHTLPR